MAKKEKLTKAKPIDEFIDWHYEGKELKITTKTGKELKNWLINDLIDEYGNLAFNGKHIWDMADIACQIHHMDEAKEVKEDFKDLENVEEISVVYRKPSNRK